MQRATGHVKIHLDKAGAQPVLADFDMLRASLVAAQAATPTALASASAHSLPASGEALTRLLVGHADADAMAVLHASFSPAIARLQEEAER
jgi:hypothetical protein